MSQTRFIQPMIPTLAQVPPEGPNWFHEVKFDGWRVQLHVNADGWQLYSKNGTDYTKRFKQLAAVSRAIPAKTAIIDCELVACDDTGMPCFKTLMSLGNKATLCLFAFDLLHLNGVDLTKLEIEERKAALATLIAGAKSPYLQVSESFDDPIKLLETCDHMNLEGIVSKRKGSSYKSGPTRNWLKVKTPAWRAINKRRWELFEKR